MKAGWSMSMAVAGAAALGGCETYRAKPIDARAHLAAYLARDGATPEVAAFAARLGAPAPGQAGAFDVADGLSPLEGEAVALVFNPELRAARAKAGIAAAGAETAGLLPDPVLGVDILRMTESVPEPWMVMGMLSFTVPVSGRLAAEKRLAGAEREAEIERVHGQEWGTRMDLRRAWVEWSAARESAGVMREFVDRLERIVAIVDRLEGAGEMARIEARLFRVERATRAAELRATELEASRREVRVKQVMGLAPGAPARLAPAVAWEGPREERVEKRESRMGGGAAGDAGRLKRYPPVAVALAEYEAAERALALEVRRQYPDLMIGPAGGEEEGMGRVGVGVSLPLPLFNANRQGVAKASAAREAARAVYEAAVERALSERALAALEHEGAAVEREALEREIVPLVDVQEREAWQVAELGEVNTVVLLETLSRRQEAKLKLIRARAAESLAAIRLRELEGPEDVGGGMSDVGREGGAVSDHPARDFAHPAPEGGRDGR